MDLKDIDTTKVLNRLVSYRSNKNKLKFGNTKFKVDENLIKEALTISEKTKEKIEDIINNSGEFEKEVYIKEGDVLFDMNNSPEPTKENKIYAAVYILENNSF